VAETQNAFGNPLTEKKQNYIIVIPFK